MSVHYPASLPVYQSVGLYAFLFCLCYLRKGDEGREGGRWMAGEREMRGGMEKVRWIEGEGRWMEGGGRWMEGREGERRVLRD